MTAIFFISFAPKGGGSAVFGSRSNSTTSKNSTSAIFGSKHIAVTVTEWIQNCSEIILLNVKTHFDTQIVARDTIEAFLNALEKIVHIWTIIFAVHVALKYT